MMKRLMAVILAAALLPIGPARADTITFDDQAIGAEPAGYTVALTGGGPAAKWEVQKAPEPQGAKADSVTMFNDLAVTVVK